MDYTSEQLKVIELRNRNILVSAAALGVVEIGTIGAVITAAPKPAEANFLGDHQIVACFAVIKMLKMEDTAAQFVLHPRGRAHSLQAV